MDLPTVADRVAQAVIKRYLEPQIDKHFHKNSFGYRPNRNAQQAIAQATEQCYKKSWVIDLDIKGFFDNISHEWMMKMLNHHTEEKWVLLYAERWLKAGIEQADGSIAERQKGTPQGGVISPLLANLYLHHAFDMWMTKHFPFNSFERYADDIIVHCNSKDKAEQLLSSVRERFAGFDLELHPAKTKLVYCKNYQRKEQHEHNSFTFLSYSFQPRSKPNTFGKHYKFTVFSPAICEKAKTFIRERIRAVFNPRNTQVSLERIATKINPKIRGWLNYYSRFNPRVAGNVFLYLNRLIRRWIEEKFRLRSKKAIVDKYESYVQLNTRLFVHWQKGIKY